MPCLINKQTVFPFVSFGKITHNLRQMPCLHRRKRAARDMSSCANGCNASLDFPPSPGLRVWGNAFSSANSNPKHVRGLFLQAPVAGMTNLVDKGCLDDRSAAPWCVVLQVPGRSSLWIAGGSCMRLRTTLQTPANNRISPHHQ